MSALPRKKNLKILIIAGESSGDQLGSSLMKQLKSNQEYDFFFWGTGGDEMSDQGLIRLKHIRELEAIGLEVLFRYRFFIKLLKRILKLCIIGHKDTGTGIADKFPKDFIQARTDLAILIDYPGFNLKLARLLAQEKIPVIFYVAPQVWAWRYSRVKKMK